jgi:hypothetical protein
MLGKNLPSGKFGKFSCQKENLWNFPPRPVIFDELFLTNWKNNPKFKR